MAITRNALQLGAFVVEGITNRARRIFGFALGRARRDSLVNLTIEIGEIEIRASDE